MLLFEGFQSISVFHNALIVDKHPTYVRKQMVKSLPWEPLTIEYQVQMLCNVKIHHTVHVCVERPKREMPKKYRLVLSDQFGNFGRSGATKETLCYGPFTGPL